MRDTPRLCLFTRAPVLGTVKRRLAASVGPAAALRAHETLVEDALRRLCRVPGAAAELWLAGPPNAAVRRWVRGYGLDLREQLGDDLGERMHHALADALERGPAAVLVGTDCPDIDQDYVADAIRRLGHSEVVLGPAEDGGYGLVGARSSVAPRLGRLFAGIPWGSGQVLTITLERATAAGLRVALLPEIWDVDTAADWQRYLARSSPAP